jgi:thiamine-phosphate pyrophosphorylase
MQQALAAGVRFFQYRNKNGLRKAVFETSLLLAKIARDAHALFIVNDHTDIAVAVDADGVHLGQDDLPIASARKLLGENKLIGISTHSLAQAQEAERSGADYIGFGPVFPTLTKDAGSAKEIAGLRTVVSSVAIPVIAIGGVDHQNVRDVIEAGAQGAAVISAVLRAEDITLAAREMVGKIAAAQRTS